MHQRVVCYQAMRPELGTKEKIRKIYKKKLSVNSICAPNCLWVNRKCLMCIRFCKKKSTIQYWAETENTKISTFKRQINLDMAAVKAHYRHTVCRLYFLLWSDEYCLPTYPFIYCKRRAGENLIKCLVPIYVLPEMKLPGLVISENSENLIKCLVPIYVLPEMKLPSLVISKTELQCSVSQFPHSCICEQYIYYKPVLLQPNGQTDPGNI